MNHSVVTADDKNSMKALEGMQAKKIGDAIELGGYRPSTQNFTAAHKPKTELCAICVRVWHDAKLYKYVCVKLKWTPHYSLNETHSEFLR